MIQNYNFYGLYPFLPPNCQKPPTIYSILNSIVNGLKDEEDYTKIKDLAKEGRETIFNFDYPLNKNISKEDFECMILNHFLMRRIGFETVTAFRIQLDVKLNEIMPLYNKMFEAIDNWDIFNDGEKTVKESIDDRTSENINNTTNKLTNESTTSNNDISDRRNSELPQNQLEDLRNGNYVTNYNYDTNTSNAKDNSVSNGSSQATNKGNDKNVYNETTLRSPADKINILKEIQENINNVYTLIFKDLECLFYQLI